MEKLKREGKNFDFGDHSGVATGGGWKGLKNMTPEEFRNEVNKVLGIPGKFVLDDYSMVEPKLPEN
ncbi:MAG: hypothetical protein NTZ75_04175 [Euryarchaeota archaeon]|nr:hypothetical protein [Euryarchaeota archaeon]